jgi:L-threonylcarbamoyladenylate synthase
MAEIITKIDAMKINAVLSSGNLIIYPTDTLYGIGCDARDASAVARIKALKGRDHPVSVLAPSLSWIKENCEIGDWIEKLPGPFTLIAPFTEGIVCAEVNNGSQLLGVRYIGGELNENLEFPIVTTSVNTHGKKPMSCLSDCEEKFFEAVELIIDVGVIDGCGSTLVFVNDGKVVARN